MLRLSADADEADHLVRSASGYHGRMGERDVQAPSALRLVGMLAVLVLVLLLGGVVAAVVLSVGTAVHRALGPQETVNASVDPDASARASAGNEMPVFASITDRDRR